MNLFGVSRVRKKKKIDDLHTMVKLFFGISIETSSIFIVHLLHFVMNINDFCAMLRAREAYGTIRDNSKSTAGKCVYAFTDNFIAM